MTNLKYKLNSLIKILIIYSIFFNNVYLLKASEGGDIAKFVAGFTGEPASKNEVQKFMEDTLKCNEFKAEYLIAMIPALGITGLAAASQGLSSAVLEGGITELSVCGKNVIIFRASWLTANVSMFAKKKITGTDPYSEIARNILLGIAIAGYASAITSVFVNYGIARTDANNAEICLSGENHPFAYSRNQIVRLLSLNNEEITPENIEDKKEKLCIKFNNKLHWLKNGECIQDFDHPICVKNVRGYDRVLYAYTPKGCPCIVNIQDGIVTMPDFKRKEDGTLALDEEGKPILTMNASDYKDRFLKNARVLGSKNTKFQPPNYRSSIIDETCYWSQGGSKRSFSISGKIVQCIYNTARNIFEKPIFEEISQSENYYTSKNKYNNDILFLQSKKNEIASILNGINSYQNIQDQSKKDNLITKINEFLTGQTYNPCYLCGSGSNVYTEQVNFLKKYYTSTCNATMACCESGLDIYSAEIKAMCYNNKISETFSTSGKTGIELLADISNSGSNYNILDIFENIETSIKIKQKKEEDISAMYYAMENMTQTVSLKYTMFDRFNNQIRFLAIILVTLWIFLIGYRIIFGELKLDTSQIKTLAINMALVYFLIFSNIWKDFLFRSVLNISQGIGTFATDIMVFENPLKDKFCNYNYYTKMAEREDFVLNGKSLFKLYCQTNTETSYRLNCYRYDNYGNCISGECQVNDSYIPRLQLEEPYYIVNYYSNQIGDQGWKIIPMYCSSLDNSYSEKASVILNKQVGEEVWYCPNGNLLLDEGYRISELKKLGLLKNTINSNDVYITAIRSSDKLGRLYELPIVTQADQKELVTRFKRRDDIQIERASLNRYRPYPIEKKYGITRDSSYLQFFDKIDCKIFRFLSMGFGGLKNPSNADFDTSDILDGLFSAIKYVFFAFPFGIIICLLMIFIAFSLLMITLKSVQSYVVGIFGLVFYIYVSPIFFALSLFESKKGARDQIIKKITEYMVAAPLSFLSLGLYMVIIDLAVFGNPTRYNELFATDGSILDNCYEDSPKDAPTACLAHKISSKADWQGAIQNIILIIGLTVAGSMLGSGTLGFALGTLTASSVSVVENINLLLPFVLKLTFSIVIILAGSNFLDSFDNTVRSSLGVKDVDLSLGGSPFDGKFSDIAGGGMVTGGIKSLVSGAGSALGKGIGAIRGKLGGGKE